MTTGHTSTTAPNKVFATREELAKHYKSDWHRYNLKRKEAGLAPVTEDDFNARLEAAMALRKEREGRELRDGKDHLKDKMKNRKTKKEAVVTDDEDKVDAPKNDGGATGGSGGEMKNEAMEVENDNGDDDDDDDDETSDKMDTEEAPPEINPLQCLFDNTTHCTLAENLEYMHQKYDFFIPDREYLEDVEGFIGYCAEKIKLGQVCLYCQKGFKSYSAVQRHMIAKSHCKVRYEAGVDLQEFEDFYDFREANEDFLGKVKDESFVVVDGNDDDDDDDDDDGEWVDMDDGDASFDGYDDVIKSHGFGVTELGELILPDGRIVGHRTLSVYYKQRFAPDRTNDAVSAQRRTERERILGYGSSAAAAEAGHGGAAITSSDAVSGRALQARGRQGQGILVKGTGVSGFSQISVYRYRAAVRKERRDEAKYYRRKMKNRNNMNRMDKKANRLMNGVSVAHALR